MDMLLVRKPHLTLIAGPVRALEHFKTVSPPVGPWIVRLYFRPGRMSCDGITSEAPLTAGSMLMERASPLKDLAVVMPSSQEEVETDTCKKPNRSMAGAL